MRNKQARRLDGRLLGRKIVRKVSKRYGVKEKKAVAVASLEIDKRTGKTRLVG
jgi:hypothetical protein